MINNDNRNDNSTYIYIYIHTHLYDIITIVCLLGSGVRDAALRQGAVQVLGELLVGHALVACYCYYYYYYYYYYSYYSYYYYYYY